MSGLKLSNVEKRLDNRFVLSDINFSVNEGEFIVLLGPSGCGKTTLLRMIAGLETVSSGNISIDGRVVNQLPPRLRDVAMVFQNYSLYMHKTVKENLAFGLKMHQQPKRIIEQRVSEIASILHLEKLLKRYPGFLSGGEKQRVAIGRALARQPKLYLFDEPLSNLDAAFRLELRTEIKRIHQKFHTTSLYVTHDQAEAMSMSDRLVVMDQGRIMQSGSAEDVYWNPQNLFVAGFLGNPGMNLFRGTLEMKEGSCFFVSREMRLSLECLEKIYPEILLKGQNREAALGVRPEHMTLNKQDSVGFFMDAQVVVVERFGVETQFVLEKGGKEFRVRMHKAVNVRAGDTVRAYFHPKNIRLFDVNTKQVFKSCMN